MGKILVTGAKGFIGKKLVNSLRRRDPKNLVLFDVNIDPKQNLRNPESLRKALEGVSVIYHLAGVSDPKSPELFMSNVIGTIGLLEVSEAVCPNCKLIFASTFAVYGPPKKGNKIDENFDKSPRNKYGLTKLLAEEAIKHFVARDKVSAVILRLSNVYGEDMQPHRHSVIASLLDSVKRERVIKVTGSGDQTRDFIHVDDVVDALVASSRVGKSLETVNVCSGEEVSIKKLLSLVNEITDRQVKAAYGSVKTDGGGYWRGDNARARKVLSWHPKVDLTQGLKRVWRGIN